MYPDGICRVHAHYFTKTVKLEDISYQLATDDEKKEIFEVWRSFYNQFDSSVQIQLTCATQQMHQEELEEKIVLPMKSDAYDPIREEVNAIMKEQLARGNNGLERVLYVTLGVDADDIRMAKPKLEQMESHMVVQLKKIGVSLHSLTGYERLQVLYELLNPTMEDPFIFHYDALRYTGLTSRDFIVPMSFDFRNPRNVYMGSVVGSVSYLQILAPTISDELVAQFLNLDTSMILTMHVHSVDQTEAVKLIRRKMTSLNQMKIEEQKKAVRTGYDMDVLPADLQLMGPAAEQLLDDLQKKNERYFLATILIFQTASTQKQLKANEFQAKQVAQQSNLVLRCLEFQQEQGLISSLPLGINQIDIARGLTTSSIAIFLPFTTRELFQKHKDALYYGVNAVSNGLLRCDKKLLKNPNSMILGKPGVGKSFLTKEEITMVFLGTEDDIMICDPEGEYFPLVSLLGGQVIHLSVNSTDYINPMDLNLNYADGDNPVSLKAEFVLSLCEMILAGRTGLEPIERTVIDRCVRSVYRAYLQNPTPETVPILGDVYKCLLQQPEVEAKRIAAGLEMYVQGSLSVFNHRTNVDVQNRLVCFDIRELGSQLKRLGMLIVQDQVWNRVTQNKEQGRYTRYYVDEFHLLLKEKQTASFSVDIWKRFRKYSGIPCGITQNVKDLLASPEIENILENSDFILMLGQGPEDSRILQEKLHISDSQLAYITNSDVGEGLLFYGNTILPFRARYPKDTILYRVMTTKPSDRMKQKEGEVSEKTEDSTDFLSGG